jgi:hypothetical protein
MKKIVLFGAGKSSTCLIDYLVGESSIHNWELDPVYTNLQAATSKIAVSKCPGDRDAGRRRFCRKS